MLLLGFRQCRWIDDGGRDSEFRLKLVRCVGDSGWTRRRVTIFRDHHNDETKRFRIEWAWLRKSPQARVALLLNYKIPTPPDLTCWEAQQIEGRGESGARGTE